MDLYGGVEMPADSEGYQSSGDHPEDDRSSSTETVSSMTPTKDGDYFEERYRVDRRKLEQMIQGGPENAEQFFSKIMSEFSVHIAWPSRLKIGAKSKKDPHIKVSGQKDAVLMAKTRIMDVLDTRMMRATLKMDVCHTEHSHIIGKGGCNIKNVMQETGCHIHFPDSNRSNANNGEKSNQVSIAGLGSTVEKARHMIRDLAPLVFMFEVPSTSRHVIAAPLPSAVQAIQRHYGVSVTIRSEQKPTPAGGMPESNSRQSVIVRGSMINVNTIVEASAALYELLTGQYSVSFHVCMPLDIAALHHLHIIGPGGVGVKQIMQMTGAAVSFPDPTNHAAHRQHTIQIGGTMASVIAARLQLLGSLPLVLMFDVKEECILNQGLISKFAEELNVYVSIKLKPKQTAKTVIIKTQERNASFLYEARQRILSFGCETTIPANEERNRVCDLSAVKQIDGYGASHDSIYSSGRQEASSKGEATAVGDCKCKLPEPAMPRHSLTTSSNAVLMYDQTVGCSVVYPYPMSSAAAMSPLPPQLPPVSHVYGYPNANGFPQLYPYQSIPSPVSTTANVYDQITGGRASAVQPVSKPPETIAVSSINWQNLVNVDEALRKQYSDALSGDGPWCDAITSLASAMNGISCTSGTYGNLADSENVTKRPLESLRRPLVGEFFAPAQSNNVLMGMDCKKSVKDTATVVSSSLPYRSVTDNDHHNLLHDCIDISSVYAGTSDRPDDHGDSVYDLLSSTAADGTPLLSEDTMALLNYIDYEQKRAMASRAMSKKPIGESRTPTHQWAGLFFSKSMPDSEIRSKLNSSFVCQDPRMTTTYEASEEDELRNEDTEKEQEQLSAEQHQSSSTEPHTICWSPCSPMTVISVGDSESTNPLPFRDTQELLKKIGFSKYSDIFLQQEIDLTTFLTLTDDDLKELGITTFGARRKMLLAIADINKQVSQMTEVRKVLPPPPGLPNPFNDGASGMVVGHSRLNVASQSGRW